MLIGVNLCLTEPYLKKQSQFADGTKRCKVLFERGLWQYAGLRGTKKQSQFKAKQSQFPLKILYLPACDGVI